MYIVYVVVLNQNTSVVGKTLFWGPGWRGGTTTSFQFSPREEQKRSLGGTDGFSTYVSNFRSPPPGGNI